VRRIILILQELEDAKKAMKKQKRLETEPFEILLYMAISLFL